MSSRRRSPGLIAGPSLRGRVHWIATRVVIALTRPVGGRGASALVDLLARVFGRGALVRVPVFEDRWLTVGLYDSYWVPRLLRCEDYEPEVGAILQEYLEPDATFVDCGSNVGWWSVFATRLITEPSRIISVEAGLPVFDLLRMNGTEAGQQFTCLHAAVWREGGTELQILSDVRRHAWSSVDPEIGGELKSYGFLTQMVETVTVDQLVSTAIHEGRRIVLKIDVEGAEREVLAGAQRALTADTVVIYEDHGRDAVSHCTAYVLSHGWEVFLPSSSGSLKRVSSAEDATALKQERAKGYNFVALRPGSRAHQSALERLLNRAGT